MAKSPKRPTGKKAKAVETAAKPFVTRLSLQVLRVSESHCVLTLTALEPLAKISVNVEAAHGMQERDTDFVVAVATTVHVTAQPVNPDNKSSLKITAKAETVYASPVEPPSAEWPQILMMGMMAAWPSLRDAVCSLSVRTGQSPVLLPILYIDPATHLVSFLLGDNNAPIPVGQIGP